VDACRATLHSRATSTRENSSARSPALTAILIALIASVRAREGGDAASDVVFNIGEYLSEGSRDCTTDATIARPAACAS
jgi:hypothetical protein